MGLMPVAEVLPRPDFAGVFQAVLSSDAEYGLCAIENNIHGPINEVYRLLRRHDVRIIMICGCILPIGCQNVSIPELARANDVRALSQAPALAQVELWLAEHLPDAVREERPDTALSVQEVVEHGDPHRLAVAGRTAAETYGGVIVAKDIQDEPGNYTRFILFTKDSATPRTRHEPQ